MPISTDKDRVRLLISDVGGQSGTDFVFSDDEIENFIELRGGVLRGAALALRTLAANEALVMKHITFLEMKTDGSIVAKELRQLAKEFDDVADEEGDTEDGVVIIEIIAESFGLRAQRVGLFR